MKPSQTDTLKIALDEARRSLTRPSFRSRGVNFAGWTRTIPLDRSGTAGEWTIAAADYRAVYDLRRAIEGGTATVYDLFVAYDPNGAGAKRTAALLTYTATVSDDLKSVRAIGPATVNRELVTLLEKLGATVDVSNTSNPVVEAGASAAELRGAPRVGAGHKTADRIAAYVDHHAHPEILAHPLVGLFVVPGRERAIPEPTPSGTDGDTAGRDGSDGVRASERPPGGGTASVPMPILDPDQIRARDLALGMRPLLVNGPPGTGKSQTITTITVEALARGRSVIITSTVASAMDVARRRLLAAHVVEGEALFVGSPQDLAARPPPTIGEPDFDLAIIDEASRMPMDLALTILVRACSVVVIGDDKQLRPETPCATVLDRAVSAGIDAVTLRYHYRSRERSLISVSNLMAYDMALRTVPSPTLSPDDGMKIIEMPHAKIVKGPGGITNPDEAQAIVRWVEENARDGRKRSIGILAANRPQKDLISKLIERSIPADGRERLGADKHEPLFVRLVEQAQGEERDVILISTVYGTAGGGREFGMFDRDGAINRVNVMLSRARHQTRLYTSLNHSDREVATWTRGAIALQTMKAILDAATYAQTRRVTPPDIRGLARRQSMQADHLGVVFGFRYAGAERYPLGLVVSDDAKSPDHWEAIVRQLDAVGWNILHVHKARLLSEPAAIDREITKALIQDHRP